MPSALFNFFPLLQHGTSASWEEGQIGFFYYYFLIYTLSLDNKGVFLIIGKTEFLSLISSC